MANQKKPSTNVTSVQVPGEAPVTASPAAAQPQGEAAPAAAQDGQAENTEAAPAAGAQDDLEAIRAQIRAEEQAKARAELGEQIQAAQAGLDQSGKAAKAAPATRGSYRNMSAADIDPASLTAPVMTRDGWLCPPAPEAAKK